MEGQMCRDLLRISQIAFLELPACETRNQSLYPLSLVTQLSHIVPQEHYTSSWFS